MEKRKEVEKKKKKKIIKTLQHMCRKGLDAVV